jgi:hypothetical protein
MAFLASLDAWQDTFVCSTRLFDYIKFRWSLWLFRRSILLRVLHYCSRDICSLAGKSPKPPCAGGSGKLVRLLEGSRSRLGISVALQALEIIFQILN